MKLESAKGDENEPAVVFAKLHVAKQAENVDGRSSDSVVRQDARDDSAGDVVSNGDALLPARNLGSEALIGETLHGIV